MLVAFSNDEELHMICKRDVHSQRSQCPFSNKATAASSRPHLLQIMPNNLNWKKSFGANSTSTALRRLHTLSCSPARPQRTRHMESPCSPHKPINASPWPLQRNLQCFSPPKSVLLGSSQLFQGSWRSKQGLWRGLAEVLWAIPQCSKPVYPDGEATGFLPDVWRT